ncbi:MAG: hypothetical protein Q8P67_12720, partial [archaeon]|nr:hypothetical protein [archaeon]
MDQSGQKTEVAEARAKARQQSVEKMATVLAESRAVNFDKLELFSLNFVFKITPHQQERIWRRSRRTTAAPSAAHQLDLDEARDRSDAALVAGTDESRLDAEIEALRQAVWKEQQRSTRLQAVNDRAQSVLASLRPVLGRAPQGQALVSLSALSDAFNSLGAQIDALAQLESVTRVALKNTMLDLTPA